MTKRPPKSTATKTTRATKASARSAKPAPPTADAQAEGSKAFEALVKEGVTLQRKTQSAAEDKIAEAASKMSSIATDMSAKATGQWDKLETIFEDRVAKALGKLGVPSAKDINALMARVDELNKSVQQLSAQVAANPRKKPAARRAAPRKAASVPI
ncbi:MAG: poly granule associated protein [Betaproteobacteria bacterium]|nr:poly granule associated protein [Betaproteobacteria bacterium]